VDPLRLGNKIDASPIHEIFLNGREKKTTGTVLEGRRGEVKSPTAERDEFVENPERPKKLAHTEITKKKSSCSEKSRKTERGREGKNAGGWWGQWYIHLLWFSSGVSRVVEGKEKALNGGQGGKGNCEREDRGRSISFALPFHDNPYIKER